MRKYVNLKCQPPGFMSALASAIITGGTNHPPKILGHQKIAGKIFSENFHPKNAKFGKNLKTKLKS